jgi:cyclopropane-fatty-acyl-phospholipid synthase
VITVLEFIYEASEKIASTPYQGGYPMTKSSAESILQELLEPADIRFNGKRPWDIRVHNRSFFDAVLADLSLALGETYMDGWWDCDALDDLFTRIMGAGLDCKVSLSPRLLWCRLKAALIGAPGRKRAFEIGRRHYDIGNDLFSVMLDRWMNYSCAYWNNAETLDQAQEAKMDLICRKLNMEPGQRVLDIGCGWGGLAAYAAKHFDVRVVGVTVSREQVKLARQMCAGLPVTIEFKDYREVRGMFDRIVSVGMFEHVCARNYRTFMSAVRRCLQPDGLFLLHTIAANRSTYECDPWIARYIFPNSMLPSAGQITSAAEGILVIEDWHSFGPDYDPTLMAWHANFTRNWHRLKETYDKRFFRMWTYYLLMCAGAFRARSNQLWQVVFSKDGLKTGYVSIR